MAYSFALQYFQETKGNGPNERKKKKKKEILFLPPIPLLCYKHLLIEQLSFEL